MANYDESLRAQHISTNLANYEAARSGFFTFIVNDLDNIIRADYTGDRSNEDSIAPSSRIANAEEVLKLNVTQASIPHFSLEPLQYRRGNEVVKFAGVPTFDAGSISVDDVVGLDTKSILMAWQALSFNEGTEKVGKMSAYKKDCELVEYAPDNTIVRYWILKGCWISGIDEDNHSFDNSDRKTITATITYDKAQMRLPD